MIEDMASKIHELHEIHNCGKKIVGPTEYFYIALPSSAKDNTWAQLRLSMVLSKSMSGARTLVTMIPLPESPQASLSERQNTLVRIMSFLDDELIDYIDQNNISIRRNPKLYHHLEAVNDAVSISNISQLHDIRTIRNSISHNITPSTLLWDDVYNAADEVENALIELDILTYRTNFECKGKEFTAMEKSGAEDEKYNRYLKIQIHQNDQLYCEYSWKYIYF
ncbi:MAG: hypothetical protein KZQ83_12965 [gamma proteobacterium symbiont of Taylorina sp.]|nr:hypothetical protein [gamma proteobacterium symbiont of Taylorina sp.]